MDSDTDNSDVIDVSSRGKKWTRGDEDKLLQISSSGMTTNNIAKTLNRTPGGIMSRLRHIAYSFYLDRVSIDDICKKTGLNNEYVLDTINRRERNKKIVGGEKKIKYSSFNDKPPNEYIRNSSISNLNTTIFNENHNPHMRKSPPDITNYFVPSTDNKKVDIELKNDVVVVSSVGVGNDELLQKLLSELEGLRTENKDIKMKLETLQKKCVSINISVKKISETLQTFEAG